VYLFFFSIIGDYYGYLLKINSLLVKGGVIFGIYNASSKWAAAKSGTVNSHKCFGKF
jgi:hypothetical protein